MIKFKSYISLKGTKLNFYQILLIEIKEEIKKEYGKQGYLEEIAEELNKFAEKKELFKKDMISKYINGKSMPTAKKAIILENFARNKLTKQKWIRAVKKALLKEEYED